MKSTFLFLVATTMMTCTALGQSSNDKKNVLPDWAFGGFERPPRGQSGDFSYREYEILLSDDTRLRCMGVQ